MKKTFFTLCISLFLTVTTSFASAEDSIGKKQLEGSINQLIAVLTDPECAKDPIGRRDKIKEILNARFSATEMAKRSLTKDWKKITEEEQKEFSDVLRRLIISSYIGKIEEYQNEQVIYRNEKLVKERYMEIETSVVDGEEGFAVNYKLKEFDGEWLVYDIRIEGVSLINNYRSQFKSFLKRKSFAELLSDLKETLKEIEQEELQAPAESST